MTTLYDNEEGAAVLINSNFAVDQGLNPKKDAIALERKFTLCQYYCGS